MKRMSRDASVHEETVKRAGEIVAEVEAGIRRARAATTTRKRRAVTTKVIRVDRAVMTAAKGIVGDAANHYSRIEIRSASEVVVR